MTKREELLLKYKIITETKNPGKSAIDDFINNLLDYKEKTQNKSFRTFD